MNLRQAIKQAKERFGAQAFAEANEDTGACMVGVIGNCADGRRYHTLGQALSLEEAIADADNYYDGRYNQCDYCGLKIERPEIAVNLQKKPKAGAQNRRREDSACLAADLNARGGKGEDEPLDWKVVDLLTNLRHLCVQRKLDFDDLLRRANNHFSDEGGAEGAFAIDHRAISVILIEKLKAGEKLEVSIKTTSRLYVALWSVGNIDFHQNPYEFFSEPKLLEVKTLAEAVAAVRAYISENNLGGGNWTGGQILNEFKQYIARISYNGRVWLPGPGSETTREVDVQMTDEHRGTGQLMLKPKERR